ncbi:hypothetical protein AAXB25_33515 [Paenibacillus lautus]|uniref:type II secretion system F family protein n=1 Tax=Paenibacillus lautus TaxID=1401 RepID=UPI003D2BDFFD
MITFVLYLVSGLLLSWGLFTTFSQQSKVKKKSERLRSMFGFEEVSNAALAAGITLRLKHYLLIIVVGLIIGGVCSYYTNNILFIGIGFASGMVVPRIIIESIKYNRRKEVLINLPGNLRLLISKLRDCKSLQKSLETSLPLMTGATKPIFEKLYQALLLDVPIEHALKQAQQEIRFRKFDDLCEKLLMGHKDGYHARSIATIRDNINEIVWDSQLLVEVDMKNKMERMKPYLTFGLCFGIVLICAFMEGELVNSFSMKISLNTIPGKIFIATMILTAVLGLWKKEKYLRLNLDAL